MTGSNAKLQALIGELIESMTVEMMRAERVLTPERFKMLESTAKPVLKAVTHAGRLFERYAHAHSRLMGGSRLSTPPGGRGNVRTLRPRKR